jgi:hypothetical protein
MNIANLIIVINFKDFSDLKFKTKIIMQRFDLA